MTLPTGKYLIRNKGFDSFVQRAAHEDHSLLPKPIVSIASGQRAYPWVIEEQSGLYTIKAAGARSSTRPQMISRNWKYLLTSEFHPLWKDEKQRKALGEFLSRIMETTRTRDRTG